MIVGLGIDLTPLGRVNELAQRHPQFVDRILTPAEREQYADFSGQRALEYLAGRWSLKESFAKAMGTGIGPAVGFQDVEVIDNQQGAPVVTGPPFAGRVHVSVSHTATLVMTEVILESEQKND